jgi:ABC-type phosphate/phosphonate transport system substrate-binding protein
MINSRSVFSFLTAIGVACAINASPASAAGDCYRGTLDAQYCDRNRDQVADLPLDSKDWVDPDTIIFSYTPVEDPAVYAKVWDGFIKHMSKVTGKKVVFFPVQSYAAQYEAMRSGRLHIAGVNTGGNPVAVSCAGLVPFAMMASKDGSFGYEMEIWRSLRRHPTPASRRPRRCSNRSSAWKPTRTLRPPSPASTTTRSSASPTRITRPRRLPIRC